MQSEAEKMETVKVRVLNTKIRLGDRTYTREDGSFELPKELATKLVNDGIVATVNTPLLPGLAEDKIKELETQNAALQAEIVALKEKIVELSTLLDAEASVKKAGVKK